MRLLALALLLLVPAAPASAQALDPASQDALAATLRLLSDPALRGPAIAASPQAAGLDDRVQALTGSPQLTQEFYRLAADIVDQLARNSGGDPARMSEALERAGRDPAAFAALLSPQTLARLRALAVEISDRKR